MATKYYYIFHGLPQEVLFKDLRCAFISSKTVSRIFPTEEWTDLLLTAHLEATQERPSVSKIIQQPTFHESKTKLFKFDWSQNHLNGENNLIYIDCIVRTFCKR